MVLTCGVFTEESSEQRDPITALEPNKSHPITQPVCVRLFLSPHSILINNVFNGLKGRTYGTRRRELLEFNKEKVRGLIISGMKHLRFFFNFQAQKEEVHLMVTAEICFESGGVAASSIYTHC